MQLVTMDVKEMEQKKLLRTKLGAQLLSNLIYHTTESQRSIILLTAKLDY